DGRLLTRAASMRRPVSVKSNPAFWGSQGASPLAEPEAAPQGERREPGQSACIQRCRADQREADERRVPKGPFPSYQDAFSGRERICQGRPALGRRSEPLTDSLPSPQSKAQGKGPGVSGGLPPGRV